jgi:outer membrane lipoprotein-sorting protein
MKKCLLAAVCALPLLSGCASKSSDIQAAYVSPIQGELEAVEKASIQKNCGIQFRRS